MRTFFSTNPWGGNNAGGDNNGGGQGPQFDLNAFLNKYLFKRGRQNNNGGGDGGGSGHTPNRLPLLIFVLPVVMVAVWLASGFYTLQPAEQAVVLRFGKYVDTKTEPGLHYHLPSPIEVVMKGNTSEKRVLEIPEDKETYSILTGDESIAIVGFAVEWNIANLKDYMLQAVNPSYILKESAESAMREIIGQTGLDRIVSSSGVKQISNKVKHLLQETVNRYNLGIFVSNINLRYTLPPSEVREAFSDVQSARNEREHLINQAKAVQNDILPRARGRAKEIIAQAEAYANKRVLEAEGHSQRFMQLLAETKKSPEVEATTKRRLYFETIEKLLEGKRKVIVDKNLNGGVLPHMSLDKIMEKAQ